MPSIESASPKRRQDSAMVILDYKSPPKAEARWWFWLAFFGGIFLGYIVALSIDDPVRMWRFGHRADGGVALLSSFFGFPVSLWSLRLFRVRRRQGVKGFCLAFILGFLPAPLILMAIYLSIAR
jgi:hypothetical protein